MRGGGWGYCAETACIIDRDDPRLPRGIPFDGVSIEYVFAEYRLYEELIVFRPREQRYAGIRFEPNRQALRTIDGRTFDVLTWTVTAFRECDFDRLKAEFEGPHGVASPDFDIEAHRRLRNSLMLTAVRHTWFDITSFFGRQKRTH